ncbi:MAG TPA: S8 family serine peptidase [Candidatus Baltobacteraceae bacterium]|nr:S8 family serine peptidase [Candidatus Baltobacteraceae bacterium]
MNGPIKLAVPLLAALAIAACSSGSNSSVPGMSGTTGTGGGFSSLPGRPLNHIPQWQAQHLAKPACPQVIGRPTCLALVESKGRFGPDVAGWAPADFQARYNLPSSSQGAGQVVAIVIWGDDANAVSDLATYRTNFGLGTANLTKYNSSGQQSSYPPSCQNYGTCVEIMLDVEMVSASCPKCTIYLIEAQDTITDLEKAETEAVTLGAHIVSNSWICYDDVQCGDSNFASYFNTPGVVYLAASGDDAYNQNGAPEALANVVSIGGTIISKSGSNYSETVWPDAGSGCAPGITKPSWQHDTGCTSRTDSDVSAVAQFVAEYDSLDGGWFTVAGTSVASPLTAGVFALAGNASSLTAAKKFWTLKKKKYKKQLHDITSGMNGSCGGSYLCTGIKGYDGPTGWGTPNGVKAY